MVETETVRPRWSGLCIVAATGPSLTPEVAEACRGHHVIAVNDAVRLIPFADVLYACDTRWLDLHKGCPGFAGEKWSSHELPRNDKLKAAEQYGLRLVDGANGKGFSLDPRRIHYAGNSGFQATNLAIHFGANPIVLVGFDMRLVDSKRHFFGEHPSPLLRISNFRKWIEKFADAAKGLPIGIRIVNATPHSALDCFPKMSLSEAVQCRVEDWTDG